MQPPLVVSVEEPETTGDDSSSDEIDWQWAHLPRQRADPGISSELKPKRAVGPDIEARILDVWTAPNGFCMALLQVLLVVFVSVLLMKLLSILLSYSRREGTT